MPILIRQTDTKQHTPAFYWHNHLHMKWLKFYYHWYFKPLNAQFNPICHLLALLGARHILHVSRIRIKPFCLMNRLTHFRRSADSILLDAAASCSWWGTPCSFEGTSAWHTELVLAGTHMFCTGPAPMTHHPT